MDLRKSASDTAPNQEGVKLGTESATTTQLDHPIGEVLGLVEGVAGHHLQTAVGNGAGLATARGLAALVDADDDVLGPLGQERFDRVRWRQQSVREQGEVGRLEGHGRPEGGPEAGRERDRGRLTVPGGATAAASHQGVPEGLAELERHDAVEDGVDGGAHVVRHARDVREQAEGDLVRGRRVLDVHGHEPLGMERGPADEEGHHHRDCNWSEANLGKLRQSDKYLEAKHACVCVNNNFNRM